MPALSTAEAPFATCATCGKEPSFDCRLHYTAEIKQLRESLAFAIDVIDHEVPMGTCACNACSDCASAFYFAENMRKARAALSGGSNG